MRVVHAYMATITIAISVDKALFDFHSEVAAKTFIIQIRIFHGSGARSGQTTLQAEFRLASRILLKSVQPNRATDN